MQTLKLVLQNTIFPFRKFKDLQLANWGIKMDLKITFLWCSSMSWRWIFKAPYQSPIIAVEKIFGWVKMGQLSSTHHGPTHRGSHLTVPLYTQNVGVSHFGTDTCKPSVSTKSFPIDIISLYFGLHVDKTSWTRIWYGVRSDTGNDHVWFYLSMILGCTIDQDSCESITIRDLCMLILNIHRSLIVMDSHDQSSYESITIRNLCMLILNIHRSLIIIDSHDQGESLPHFVYHFFQK